MTNLFFSTRFVTAILDRGSDLFPFRSVQPEPEGEQEID
jgi:hypothetical protein